MLEYTGEKGRGDRIFFDLRLLLEALLLADVGGYRGGDRVGLGGALVAWRPGVRYSVDDLWKISTKNLNGWTKNA